LVLLGSGSAHKKCVKKCLKKNWKLLERVSRICICWCKMMQKKKSGEILRNKNLKIWKWWKNNKKWLKSELNSLKICEKVEIVLLWNNWHEKSWKRNSGWRIKNLKLKHQKVLKPEKLSKNNELKVKQIKCHPFWMGTVIK
jgi:hypothetical protein